MASVRSTVGTSDMPVLIRSDFPESEPFNWLNDETRKGSVRAPYHLSKRRYLRASADVLYSGFVRLLKSAITALGTEQ